MDYRKLLDQVQQHISVNYAAELETEFSPDYSGDSRLPEYIRRYLQEHPAWEGDAEELIIRLYNDMARYGWLTPYLLRQDIEEININSWDCAKIMYRNGQKETIYNGFPSPGHAIAIFRRLLRESGGSMDESHPQGNAWLRGDIRIITNQQPVVREAEGLTASIRFVAAARLTNEAMGRTASEELLSFLKTALRYGLNIMVAGETGSGKTNTLNYLLRDLLPIRRVVSIEEGSRELDLRVRDANGRVTNDCVQFITREHDDPQLRITQSDLLRTALRYDPDLIVMGEVRSKESFAVQEAARTHTVISTCHCNTAEGVYDRLVSMAKQMMDYNDEYLLKLMLEAFPLIVFQYRQPEDNSRRITEVLEGERLENGRVIYRHLFSYDGKQGWIRRDQLSDKRIEALLQHGMPWEKKAMMQGVKE